MANLYNSMESFLASIGRSRYLSTKNHQYICAFSGILAGVLFGLGFVVSGFLPPTRAYWSAEETAHFYQTHTKRIHGGSALLCLSGMFYLPFSTAISVQMSRIPKLHWGFPALQLACGAAGVWTFMLPGCILGAVAFRPYRPVEITQAANELFWICALMPWPTFFIQNLTFAWAILYDQRARPLFPRWVAIFNIFVTLSFTPALGLHTTTTGPMAWHSVFPFWLPCVTFVPQLILDSIWVMGAISKDMEEDTTLSFPTLHLVDPDAKGSGTTS